MNFFGAAGACSNVEWALRAEEKCLFRAFPSVRAFA
jgi:hypothetical protein